MCEGTWSALLVCLQLLGPSLSFSCCLRFVLLQFCGFDSTLNHCALGVGNEFDGEREAMIV